MTNKIESYKHSYDVGHTSIFLYQGKVNQSVVIHSVSLIEAALQLNNGFKINVSKVKTIGIEMFQNISKHGYHETDIDPFLELYSIEGAIVLRSGNVVEKKDEEIVKNKIAHFDSIDLDNFKNYYLEMLGNTRLTKDGNAGLGLLTIFYRSLKNAQVEIITISDKLSYLILKVTLPINKN